MTQQNFNFTDPGWAPAPPYVSNFSTGEEVEECYAQWVGRDEQWNLGSDLQWGECPEPFTYLKQIWTDDNYVYAATTDGLNIIDLVSEQAYAHVTYRDGFNSVWADENKVYLATPASGVKYIEKTCISGSIISPYELSACLVDYLNEPTILSNMVRYIHGNNGHMVFSTAAGVDYRGPDPYYQNAKGLTEIARKVFINPTGRIYYTSWDGSDWKINIKYANNQDWSALDDEYTLPVDILDIFVADDLIFAATISGIYVINESTDDIDVYYTGVSGLAGTSNIFTAVWADSYNNRMHALSWGLGAALSIYDLDTQTLYDYYTQSYGGRGEETLTNIDTRDLNVDTP